MVEERHQAITSDFNQKQRKGLWYRLELKAKGKCPCGQPLGTEKIVIGHDTSQQFFADSCIPIADAIKWCNSDANLVLMHERCNALQGVRTLQEVFKKKQPTGPYAKSKIHVSFAHRIRQQRVKKEISQEELAFRAGLHTNTIRRLETLRYDPKLSTINKIARVLKVQLRNLVG